MTGAQREFLFFIFLIFQDISGLAVQRLADVVQGGESYGLRLLVLQDREVGGGDADLRGEVTGGDLPLRHHDIEINNDCHNYPPP